MPQDALDFYAYIYKYIENPGLKQMADVFSRQMANRHSTSFTTAMLSMCIRTFIGHSLSYRSDTKEGWIQLANETNNDDCWKEIMLALRVRKQTAWRPRCSAETLPRIDGRPQIVRLKGKEMATGSVNYRPLDCHIC